jgi:hypothetical protein
MQLMSKDFATQQKTQFYCEISINKTSYNLIYEKIKKQLLMAT